jgi:hypothetical protein
MSIVNFVLIQSLYYAIFWYCNQHIYFLLLGMGSKVVILCCYKSSIARNGKYLLWFEQGWVWYLSICPLIFFNHWKIVLKTVMELFLKHCNTKQQVFVLGRSQVFYSHHTHPSFLFRIKYLQKSGPCLIILIMTMISVSKKILKVCSELANTKFNMQLIFI